MDGFYEYEPHVRRHLLLEIFSALADPTLDLETLREIANHEAIPYMWRWQEDFEGHFIDEPTEVAEPLGLASINLIKLLADIAHQSGLPKVVNEDGALPDDSETASHAGNEEAVKPKSPSAEPELRDANDSNSVLDSTGAENGVADETNDAELQGSPAELSKQHLSYKKDEGATNDVGKTIEYRFRYLSAHDADFCELALSILFYMSDGSGDNAFKPTTVINFPALGRLSCSFLNAVNVNVSMAAARVLSQLVGVSHYFPPIEIPQLLLAMSLNIPLLNGSASKWDGAMNPLDPLALYLTGERKLYSGSNNEQTVDEESLSRLDDPVEFAANSVGINSPYYIGKLRLKRASKDPHQLAILASQQMYSLATLMVLLSPRGFESVVTTRAPDALHSLLDVCQFHHESPEINYVKSRIIEAVTIILSFWTKADDERVFKRWQLAAILRDLHIPGLDSKYLYQLCDLASFAPLRVLIPLMPRLVEMSVDQHLPPEGRLRTLDMLARILMTPEFGDENIIPDKMLESLMQGLQADISSIVEHQKKTIAERKSKKEAKTKSRSKSKGKRSTDALVSSYDRSYELITERLEVLNLWIAYLTWSDLDRTILNTPMTDTLISMLTEQNFVESLPTRALTSAATIVAKICESEQARVLLLSEQGFDDKIFKAIMALSKAENRQLDLTPALAILHRCLWGNPERFGETFLDDDDSDFYENNKLSDTNLERMREATEKVFVSFGSNMAKLLKTYSPRAAVQCKNGLISILMVSRARKLDYQSWFSKLLTQYLNISCEYGPSPPLSLSLSDLIGSLLATYQEAVSVNRFLGGLLVRHAIMAPKVEIWSLVQDLDPVFVPDTIDDTLRTSVELAVDGQPLHFMRLLKFTKHFHRKNDFWLSSVVPLHLIIEFMVDAVVFAIKNLNDDDVWEMAQFEYLRSIFGSSVLSKFVEKVLSLFEELPLTSEEKNKLSIIIVGLMASHTDDATITQQCFNVGINMIHQAAEKSESAMDLSSACRILDISATEEISTSNADQLSTLKLRLMLRYGLDAFIMPELNNIVSGVDRVTYLMDQIDHDNLEHSMNHHAKGVKYALSSLSWNRYIESRKSLMELVRYSLQKLVSEDVEWASAFEKGDRWAGPLAWLSLADFVLTRLSSVPEVAVQESFTDLVQETIETLVTKIGEMKPCLPPTVFVILHHTILSGIRCLQDLHQNTDSESSNAAISDIMRTSLPYSIRENFISACKTYLNDFMGSCKTSSLQRESILEDAIIGLSSVASLLIQSDIRLASVAVESGLIQELIDASATGSSSLIRCVSESLISLCHVIVASPAVMAGLLLELLNGHDNFHRSNLLDGRKGNGKSPAEAILQRKPQLWRIVEAVYVKSASGRLTQWHIAEKAAKQIGMKLRPSKALNVSKYHSLPKKTMRALISQLVEGYLSSTVPHQAEILSDVLQDLIVTTGSARETLLTLFPRFVEEAIVSHSGRASSQDSMIHDITYSSQGSKLCSQLIGSLTYKAKDEPHSLQTLKSLERTSKQVLHAITRILDSEVPRRKRRYPTQAVAILHSCCDIIANVWGDRELAWANLAFVSELATPQSDHLTLYNQAVVVESGVVEAMMRAFSLFDFNTQDLSGLRSCALELILHFVRHDSFKIIQDDNREKGDSSRVEGRIDTLNNSNADSEEAGSSISSISEDEDDEMLEADLAAERRREHQQRAAELHGDFFRNSSLGEYESSTSESEQDSLEMGLEDSDGIAESNMIDLSDTDSSERDSQFDSESEMSDVSSSASNAEGDHGPEFEITLVLSADEDGEDDDEIIEENRDSNREPHSAMEQDALDSYLGQIDMQETGENSMTDEERSDINSEEEEIGGDLEQLPIGLEVEGGEILLLYGDRNHGLDEGSESAEELNSAEDLDREASARTHSQLHYFESAFQRMPVPNENQSGYNGIAPIRENSELVWDWLQLSGGTEAVNSSMFDNITELATDKRLLGDVRKINEFRRLLNSPQLFATWRFALKDENDARLPFLSQLVSMLSRIAFTDIFEHDRFVVHEIMGWLSLSPIGPHVFSTLLNILFDASRGHVDSVYASLTRIAAPHRQSVTASPSKGSAAQPSLAVPSATTPALVCSNVLLILGDFFDSEAPIGRSFKSAFYADIVNFTFGSNGGKMKGDFEDATPLYQAVQTAARDIVTQSGPMLISLCTRPLIRGFREQQISASNLVSDIFAQADEARKTLLKRQPPADVPSIQLKLDSTLLQQIVDVLGSRQCNSRVFYNLTDLIRSYMSTDAFIFPIVEATRNTKVDLTSSMLSISREQQRPTDSYRMARLFDDLARDQLRILRLFTLIGELFSQYKCLLILLRLGVVNFWSKIIEFVEVFRRKQTLGRASLMALLDVVTLPADIILREYDLASQNNADENDYVDEGGSISAFAEEVSSFLKLELPRCQSLVNEQLRQNTRLMSGPLGIIARKYKLLDFENKQLWLEEQLESTRELYQDLTLRFVFKRNNVLQGSYEEISKLEKEELQYPITVEFENEPGVDEGGLAREWFEILSREIVNPAYGLFSPTVVGSSVYQINPAIELNDERLDTFRFVGRILGRAVYDSRPVGLHFSRVIYKYILNQSISLSDMEAVDQEYHKSLSWMLENDITEVFFETFSYEYDKFGSTITVDLIPDGRNVTVTEENKHEYVKRIVEYRLVESVEDCLKALKNGFLDVLDENWVSDFNEQELELLISGMPDIDVDDWKRNTVYEGYSEASPQVVWFWLAVKSFNAEQRARLLQFSTGTSRVPARGFGMLESNTGVGKFLVHKENGSTDRLPSSHTCMNQISLPEYGSYKKLRALLLRAITEGNEGFGFA